MTTEHERSKSVTGGVQVPSPLPNVASSGVDGRAVEIWCAWLGALATDAEAALAAALAYKALDEAERARWLTALEQDAQRLDVPLIAVYAPLLAVEADPHRRSRIQAALAEAPETTASTSAPRALVGRARQGQVAVIVSPLYLDFVQVLACGWRRGGGFDWVRHDPIVIKSAAPRAGAKVEGAMMETAPLKPLIDELAHVVLAHGRSGRELPEAVRLFADLFAPTFDVAADEVP